VSTGEDRPDPLERERDSNFGYTGGLDLADPEVRLRIIGSEFGRTPGWWVETPEGLRIAKLTDPRFEEMFWTSYAIEYLTESPEHLSPLRDANEWCVHGLVMRSIAIPELIAPHASPAGLQGAADRFVVRGDYLRIPGPTRSEALELEARGMPVRPEWLALSNDLRARRLSRGFSRLAPWLFGAAILLFGLYAASC